MIQSSKTYFDGTASRNLKVSLFKDWTFYFTLLQTPMGQLHARVINMTNAVCHGFISQVR